MTIIYIKVSPGSSDCLGYKTQTSSVVSNINAFPCHLGATSRHSHLQVHSLQGHWTENLLHANIPFNRMPTCKAVYIHLLGITYFSSLQRMNWMVPNILLKQTSLSVFSNMSVCLGWRMKSPIPIYTSSRHARPGEGELRVVLCILAMTEMKSMLLSLHLSGVTNQAINCACCYFIIVWIQPWKATWEVFSASLMTCSQLAPGSGSASSVTMPA